MGHWLRVGPSCAKEDNTRKVLTHWIQPLQQKWGISTSFQHILAEVTVPTTPRRLRSSTTSHPSHQTPFKHLLFISVVYKSTRTMSNCICLTTKEANAAAILSFTALTLAAPSRERLLYIATTPKSRLSWIVIGLSWKHWMRCSAARIFG